MKTVPLSGKKAAGRVARVDDGDYELVMQYVWHIHDPEPRPGQRRKGPYAVTNGYVNGVRHYQRMHCLIMGLKGIDHIDHDGLNNQRYNLRPATPGENARNIRPRLGGTSRYKGVHRTQRGLWRAYIEMEGRRHNLGDCASELEAAYAHDAAARELHGEFACPNFPEGPTPAMREQWRAAHDAYKAVIAAGAGERRDALTTAIVEWWAGREPETLTCKWCGRKFQSRAVGRKFYCGKECNGKAARSRRSEERRQRRMQREEGRLF